MSELDGDRLLEVRTRGDFISHTQGLLKEIMEKPEAWENCTLPEYLAALIAWVEDMDGYYLNTGQTVPEDVNWRVLADILSASRYYS